MTKRIIIVIGLTGFLITWAGLAIYGAICIAKRFGWML